MSDIENGLEDEVREALRELVAEIGAVSARIVENDDLRTGVPARTIALGGGEFLRVELGTRSSSEVPIEQAFEHVTRQLRAIRRRWEVSRLPEIMVGPGAAPTSDKVTDRIAMYLKGLAGIDRASNAFVTRAGKLIAFATAPDETENSRWQFLARRTANTHAPGSSYGEIVDQSGKTVGEPIDFVRHRCRQVARELANLLPMLEPDPDAPAAIRRRPPTLP